MDFQTEVLDMAPFRFRRSRRQFFVSAEPSPLGGVFLAEFGDVGAGGTYDFGPPSSQPPGTTHARITYAQITSSGTGSTSFEVVCDGVAIDFASALVASGGTVIVPALPDQFVEFDVTFNITSDATDGFNIVLYGLWEP